MTPVGAGTDVEPTRSSTGRRSSRPSSAPAAAKPFTVVVNHFKSKNCAAGSPPADTDQGDGQSCFNARRVAAGDRRWRACSARSACRTRSIIGDLNSYTEEDPIHVLEGAGYTGLTELHVDDADRYSFVFDGFSGELDHALAAPTCSTTSTGATIWHINADEPLILDYNPTSVATRPLSSRTPTAAPTTTR